MSPLRKILNIVLLVIVLIPTGVVVGLQFPIVQTFVCNKAAGLLSRRLDGDVSVGKVYLSFPNSFILKDIVVHQGSEGDSLAYVGKLLVHASVTSAFTDDAHIHRISIENGFARLEKLDDLLAPMKSIKKKPEPVAAVEKDSVPIYKSVTLDRLTIKNMSLSTLSKKPPKKVIDWNAKPHRVNWRKLGLTDINADIRHIVWADSLTAHVEDLRIRESRGWVIEEFNADIALSQHCLHVDNLHYRDDCSDLTARRAYFDYEQMSDIGQFAKKGVAMDIDLDNTFLDMRSLRYFGGGEHLRLRAYLSGRVTGSVGRISTDNLRIQSETRRTNLSLKAHIVGLPIGKETMAGAKLDISTDMPDIARMASQLTKKPNFDRSKTARLAPGEKIRFKGSLDGLFTDFVAHGGISTTSAGGADIDIVFQTDKERGNLLEGYLSTESLDLGKIASGGDGKLGTLTCDGVLSMLTGRALNVNLDEFNISHFGLGDNSFENISITGNIGKENSAIRVVSDDDWLKFSLGASAEKLSLKDMALEVDVDSLKFHDSAAVHDIGPIHISSASRPDGSFVNMQSRFADLDFESSTDLKEFIDRVKAGRYSATRARLDIETGHLQPLLDVFAPDFFVEPGTHITYSAAPDSTGRGHISSELLAIGNKFFKGLAADIAIDTLDNVGIELRADTLQAGNAIAGRNDINLRILSADVPGLKAEIADSHFNIGDVEWTLAARTLAVADGDISLDSLRVSHENHFIAIDGTLGKDEEDTLDIKLHDLRLELFNSLFARKMDLHGSMGGYGRIYGILGPDKGLIADIAGDSLGIENRLFGDLSLKTAWNPERNWLDVSLENTLHGKKRLAVDGCYAPGGHMDINAALDSLNPGFVEPLLSSVVGDLDGSISGRIHIAGQKDSLRLESAGCFMEGLGFKLLFTQVPYTLTGPFSLDGGGLHLDGIVLRDPAEGVGTLSGGVLWDNFKNTRVALGISVRDILALNTRLSDNEQFYGKAFATGNLRLSTKPSGGLALDIEASTGRGTSVHIPLSSKGKEQVSTLRFIGGDRPAISSYDSLRFRQIQFVSKAAGKGVEVNLGIEATRDAEIQVEVNRSTGDILKARGDGRISLKAGGGADNKFDIRGDYIVNSGSYKFTLVGGIVSKEFSIEPGGTIAMTGDVMQSEVDMVAKYSTKASISTLIQDTTASGSRRTVNCGIGISGMLSNPELAFSIDIPDLDPSTAGKVESALNNEEKRMKQVLAVLLSGSFIPEEDGGIVNSTTVLYSNVSEIMANQFNNIFHQLDIPLDFGFNYQPTESGSDLFDVAVSTQLFNNRVRINGNIGNRQDASTNKSDIVGDVDVEIKLLANGKLLLNLFSHSADQYTNYLDQSQRNGLGFVYQEEFDTVQELWRKIFWSRKRREAEELKKQDETR